MYFGSNILPMQGGLYLQYLVVNPLRSLENYFGDSSHSRGLLNSADSEDGSSMGLKRKASRACKCKHGEASMFSYLNAFKFLCKQLVKYVDTTWEYMGSVTKFVTFSDEITYVWDALTQFCDMLTLSDTPEERARWHQCKETMLRAVVAALRIALGSGRDLEKPCKYIDHLISSGRIEPENLNTLVRIIYNTGATLANNKQMEQEKGVNRAQADAMRPGCKGKSISRVRADVMESENKARKDRKSLKALSKTRKRPIIGASNNSPVLQEKPSVRRSQPTKKTLKRNIDEELERLRDWADDEIAIGRYTDEPKVNNLENSIWEVFFFTHKSDDLGMPAKGAFEEIGDTTYLEVLPVSEFISDKEETALSDMCFPLPDGVFQGYKINL